MKQLALPTLSIVVALAVPATASAVPVVVTGSPGKDEVSVKRIALGSRTGVQVIGAATVTGSECATVTSSVSGRAVAVNCPRGGDGITVDLGEGDDVLDLDIADQDIPQGMLVTVNGGAGADLLSVTVNSQRTVKGGDGDDTLAVRFLGRNDRPTATLDGGAGRDLVDYASADEGVSASLATGVATMISTPRDAASGTVIGPTVTRTDSLVDVERLSGSPASDLLVGGTKVGADLFGQGGNDVLRGGTLNDALDGGPGSDLIDGGDGADTLTGGPGSDGFAEAEKGADTYQTRDAFIEDIVCGSGDVLVIDLVDRFKNPELCPNRSVAAAKHLLDTQLTHVALKLAADGTTRARVQCPEAKAERCAGTLTLRLGGERGSVLARGRYALAPGSATRVLLRLSRSSAARARGKAVTLNAEEIDLDKRPRRVFSAVRVRG
jgi:hypothetical protein